MTEMPIADDAPEAVPSRRAPLRRASRAAAAREQDEGREPQREDARVNGPRLTRQRKRTDDRFYIPRSLVPAHMSWEWKREKVYGMPDLEHMTGLRENHWSPVDGKKYPGLITHKDGMVLMERPKYLTDEARQEDFDIATSQVRTIVDKQLRQTPEGTFTRDHPSARGATKLNSEYRSALTTNRDGVLIPQE